MLQADGQRLEQGRLLYLENCSTCHRANGEGFAQVYPNLAGNPIVRLPDPAPTIDTVLRGRASMPSFAGKLTPEQISVIVSYVRHAWGNDASAIQPGQAR